MSWSHLRACLDAGLTDRAYPGVVCEVGDTHGVLVTECRGRLSYDSSPACTADTLYDLASLTKVIATSSLVMRWVRIGRLAVTDPVRQHLPEWRIAGADQVTIAHLLDHSSGLPAHVPLWTLAADAAELRRRTLEVALERPVGRSAVYSDVGFLVLGQVLERLGGSLADQWAALWPESYPWLGFLPDASWIDRIAPTELDELRGLIRGAVHDENAFRLGGVAPHAGLFGTAPGVGWFARAVLRTLGEPTWLGTPDLMAAFTAPSPVPGSSRALGWDTMRPTSSCGRGMSPQAFGHTGFTGTSLWIDPVRDLYVVLLTNRVHPTRRNEAFVPMRALIHDAIAADIERARAPRAD